MEIARPSVLNTAKKELCSFVARSNTCITPEKLNLTPRTP